MIKDIMGIEYGRGACAVARDGGPANAPAAVKKMFPRKNWTIVTPARFSATKCAADRFAENTPVQKKICAQTPTARHIMIGGDHSVNFGHFVTLADRMSDTDLCLIYIDAHLDIHTPTSSHRQASGAPHGTNVRALLGTGDARWMALMKKKRALKPRTLFYLGTRSYEPAEIDFVQRNNIFVRTPDQIKTKTDLARAIREIKDKIGDRPYVVSFDFDAIDPKYFRDVWVPERGGISVTAAETLVREFAPDAHSFEFVEYAPTGDRPSADIVKTLVTIALNA